MARIRDALIEDVTQLAGLLGELGYAVPAAQLSGRLARFLTDGRGRVLVLESDGHVQAFAALEVRHPLHHAMPVAYLSSIAVAAFARRQGLGRRLLQAVEEAAQQRGCRLLVLTSAEHRMEAHGFYVAAGYACTGRRFAKSLDGDVGVASGPKGRP